MVSTNPWLAKAGITAFPYAMAPMNNITPLTYRDGITYLKMLEALSAWVQNTVAVEFQDALEAAFNDFEAGIKNAEDTIIENKNEWQALFDDFMAFVVVRLEGLNDQAVANNIDNTVTETHKALDRIYTTQETHIAALTAVNTELLRLKSVDDAQGITLNTHKTEIDANKTEIDANKASANANFAATNGRIAEIERIHGVKPVDVIFIGDSYFTGYQPLPTAYIKSVPTMVVERLNNEGLLTYVSRNYSGNAGGYDSSGGTPYNTYYQTQVDAAIAANHSNCRLIIFGGGRNDSNSGKDVYTKAKGMYAQMRAKYPMAKIIVAPLWDNTKFTANQLKTFKSILKAATDSACSVDVNSLWIGGLTVDSEWIDSVPHPKLMVAEMMGAAIYSMIKGTKLPGLSSNYYVHSSSGVQEGVANLDGFTVTLTMQQTVGAAFGNTYVLGTVDAVMTPARNQYFLGFSGNGATTNLYQIIPGGNITLQASTGGVAGLMGFQSTYPIGV